MKSSAWYFYKNLESNVIFDKAQICLVLSFFKTLTYLKFLKTNSVGDKWKCQTPLEKNLVDAIKTDTATKNISLNKSKGI